MAPLPPLPTPMRAGLQICTPLHLTFKLKAEESKFCIWVDYHIIFQSFWFCVGDVIIGGAIGKNNFWPNTTSFLMMTSDFNDVMGGSILCICLIFLY